MFKTTIQQEKGNKLNRTPTVTVHGDVIAMSTVVFHHILTFLNVHFITSTVQPVYENRPRSLSIMSTSIYSHRTESVSIRNDVPESLRMDLSLFTSFLCFYEKRWIQLSSLFISFNIKVLSLYSFFALF